MRSAAAVVLVLAAAVAAGVGRTPTARWVERAAGEWVVALDGVRGAGCPDGFIVRTAGAPAGASGVAGRCVAGDSGLVFEPSFALVAGMTYEASLPGTASVRLSRPRSVPDSTTTVRLFPTASVLPENQLKLYLEFSAPMSLGGAADRVHLLDETGREVPRAFLVVDQELWNASRDRLTVLFDPGRIKRGLRGHDEMGPPLVAGRRFTIVVDRDWPDGRGAPLAQGVVKRFEVAAADRTRPAPVGWRVVPPQAGGSDAVGVEFGEPMDHALAGTSLRVLDERDIPVAGSIALADDERSWRFVPATPWLARPYTLEVATTLEDLGGNNLLRVFDVDLGRDAPGDARPVRLPFRPRSGTF